MTTTDTPRTDAFHYESRTNLHPFQYAPLLSFARQLERELAASKAEVERLRAIIAQLIHYPECWDTACYETMDDAIHEIGNLRDCFDCQCDQCEFNNPTDK